MRRPIVLGFIVAVLALVALSQIRSRRTDQPVIFEPTVGRLESAPLCPWREPEANLQALFLGATRYEPETRILSSMRVELTRRLGRVPQPDENALLRHRVLAGPEECLGFVLTRR